MDVSRRSILTTFVAAPLSTLGDVEAETNASLADLDDAEWRDLCHRIKVAFIEMKIRDERHLLARLMLNS